LGRCRVAPPRSRRAPPPLAPPRERAPRHQPVPCSAAPRF
jgi:hypothetical protein